jgi:hypothetical protein
MTTLLIGFVGLVILPALILAEVLNRVIKEPAESAGRRENVPFTLSTQRPQSGRGMTNPTQ